jgi:succinate dehydrogenase/fumarate reductase-like Fe-S protein
MEKLTVELDCKKKTCGKCRFTVKASKGTACGLFVEVLESVKNDYKRLPKCITVCKAQN